MAEQIVLYRKYRPHTFQDVVGQEHVTTVLEGAIKQGNIAHAYLFSGSRGTGKTSVARILARELGTAEKDLYEIDAASNRGIDDIRELREAVVVLPFESKYKVYIVDEVHMLTKEAFNALLKTLEEPPPHALFVLATTEVDRLPDTVISRCQTFTFKKPSTAVLKQVVLDVAKKEKLSLEPEAAELIALLSEGSFRDALGILQKIIASSAPEGKKSKTISIEDVELVTGAPRGKLVGDIVESIEENNIERALSAVRAAAEDNVDMKILLKLILQKVRTVLLLRFAPDLEEALKAQHSGEDFKLLKTLSGKKESNISARTLKRLLEAYDDTSYAYISQLPLELALVELVGSG